MEKQSEVIIWHSNRKDVTASSHKPSLRTPYPGEDHSEENFRMVPGESLVNFKRLKDSNTPVAMKTEASSSICFHRIKELEAEVAGRVDTAS